MKKLKALLFIIAALLTMWSCEDFTNLAPYSERNVDSFYQTQNDFVVAINGAYAGLAGNSLFGRNLMLLHEMRTDNTSNDAGATGLSESLERITLFTEITTASELYSTWSGGYETIAMTNTILGRLGPIDFTDSDLKDRIKGEALFIRALAYYNLAVTFGNIAYQFEEVTSPDITINQVTASEIYDKIAIDLALAETLLPDSYDAADIGRVTSGAAGTLLGLVQLTNGNNTEAEAALRRVMTRGYDLVPVYADLWGVSNENNIESIFEIQYKSGGTDTGGSFTEYYSTDLRLTGGIGDGNVPQGIEDNALLIFDPLDERYDGTFGTTVDLAEYISKYDGTQSLVFDSDNNFVVFRYADVLLMLAEALGEGTEANGLIDQVRNRAGLTVAFEDLPGTFEDNLLLERRREFIAENKRWPDLLRFGKAKEVMAAFHSGLGYTENDIRLLYPIPQQEIDSAPDELVQNDL